MTAAATTARTKQKPYRFVQRLLDRHGHLRHYLRRPGFARVTLTGHYGSAEFAESYRVAMGGGIPVGPLNIGADRNAAGSFGWLIGSYLGSKRWTAEPPEGLAENSKKTRKPILEKLRTSDWARIMVCNLAAKHIRKILEDAQGHQKKHMLKTLRGLFAHAIELELIEDDPSVGIKVKLPKSDGYWTWLDEEIAQYRAHHPLGTKPRLVMEFALETASRRCEVARVAPAHIKKGRIVIKRAKGCDAVNILLTPALTAALDAMPRKPVSEAFKPYLLNAKGEQYTPDQLGTEFAEWATEAGLPDRCRLHGLRKARTAELASKGATPHGIMGITGHKSLAEVQRYADKFNRERAGDAAMALLQEAV